MITPGTYAAKAVDASLGETKEGKPYVMITFEITDGEHATSQVPWFGHFTDKTRHQTARTMKLLGFTGTDIRQLDTVRGSTSITVENEASPDGQMRARVRFVGPRQVQELAADKAANFSAQLAGLFADNKNSKADAPF